MIAARYDTIGRTYDLWRRPDSRLVADVADALALSVQDRLLDISCGTGNYTVPLSERARDVIGLDISQVMLSQARHKPSRVAWVQADAHRLPFAAGAFDKALCQFAIHHFSDLDAVLREVRRVLRDGPFVMFTGFPDQMQSYWLCHYFPEMMARSADVMPGCKPLEAALRQAGFTDIDVRPWWTPEDIADLFLYSGKGHPEVYLDATVRAGISSFAVWCPPAELRSGLARLESDIASGRARDIAAAATSPLGDYAFVICH